MSIFVGNLPNDVISDNRLNFNSYNNSNIIYLNVRDDSHPNAIINFKNNYGFGFSNNAIVLNKNSNQIFNINEYRSYYSNEFFIKSNLNTSNNITFINSNLIIGLFNSNNYLSVISSNYQQLFNITNSNILFNINNSNKINITSNNIFVNENLTFTSNNFIAINLIKSLSSNTPVVIDYVKYNTLEVTDNNAKGSMNVLNDTYYPKPSITIKRLPIDCNIMEIYNSNFITTSNNRIFSINQNGFIGIGSNNSRFPIDIQITSNSNNPIIFNYQSLLSSSNDFFNINNRGYIGIGTQIPKSQIDININDEIRNIINPPVINLNLTYNSNLNYRTNNPINLQYIASSNSIPIFNSEDAIIGYSNITSNNLFFKFSSNITNTTFSLNPPSINSTIINVSNFINNDYITTYGISNIINYNTCNHLPFRDLLKDTITYIINYDVKYPSFLNYDLNEINVNNNRINPIGSYDTINTNIYRIEYTNYIYKSGTNKPYTIDNFILKEEEIPIFRLNPNNPDSFTIRLKHRLYIEKGIYEIKNFIDSITYIYQSPPNLIYATSNNNFSISLSSEGKLALGDPSPQNNYYLYVNKKVRLDNLECSNFSSIPNKNNINFNYCNISNINKGFFNSNISSNIIAQNGFFSNIFINNLNTSNLFVKEISIGNLQFSQITSCNLTATSNLFNSMMNMLIGSNTGINGSSSIPSAVSNSLLGISMSSNNSNNGLSVHSLFNNTNPSLSISGYGSNNFPTLNFTNLNASYSINMINDNFNLFNNKNNRIIYKHNNLQDLFTIGASNNIIFDLKTVDIPTNSTNRISIGYPYRFLTQNSINNWENVFNNNQLNSKAMFNVYGNVNLSSINNTPFINCIANDLPSPYEVVNVCIGSNITRNGFIFNVEGNAYFSSNIYVESNIFVKGTIGNVSDLRVKENLTIINNPIDKIDKINGYIYKRKDTGKIESGLVAQEVLKILPEVVNLNNDYYNISYGNLSGLLVEGIKELNFRLKNIEDLLLKSSNLSYDP